MYFDLHTHHKCSEGRKTVINLPFQAIEHPESYELVSNQWYSAGVHPWWVSEIDENKAERALEYWLIHPQVVAVGECGWDRLKPNLELQQKWFCKQAKIAKKLHFPMILHCVKAYDLLLKNFKNFNPKEKWIAHGFRGKPALAKQLIEKGLYLSFGEFYNLESFTQTPEERRFLESDEGRYPEELAEKFAFASL